MCDEGHLMKFNKDVCLVINNEGTKILSASRSSDNCYLLNLSIICNSASSNISADFWHERLGHTSLSNLKKIVYFDVVKGLPKFIIDEKEVCDACDMISKSLLIG